MLDDANPDDVKNLWLEQETEKVTITLDEIRHRATRFERRILWRNLREYGGAAMAVTYLTATLFRLHGWHLVPPVLLIVGALYVIYQLYRRGSRSVPADAGTRSLLEFHRVELERQRDALRSIWSWYLLPFVPGFAAALVQIAVEQGIGVRFIAMAAFFALILGGVSALNQWAARKLDRKIDEVKALAPNYPLS